MSSIGFKRKQEDDSDTDVLPSSKYQRTYQKHEKYWNVDDSQILLQIDDTRFKVHKSRLVSQSKWFAALISQRMGVVPSEPCERQDELDAVLASVEQVDGMDLFFLDTNDVPDHLDAFVQFLKAMDEGINYACKPPICEHIALLFHAATFYQATGYESFCKMHIHERFPTAVGKLRIPMNIDVAVQGVLLAGRYPSLEPIARRAFYELAKARPTCESNASGAIGETMHSREASPLNKLSPIDLVTLSDIQKNLAMSWFDIIDATQQRCKVFNCKAVHPGLILPGDWRREYAFDPLNGIRFILFPPVPAISKEYCSDHRKQVRAVVINEENKIWANMGIWLGIGDASA